MSGLRFHHAKPLTDQRSNGQGLGLLDASSLRYPHLSPRVQNRRFTGVNVAPSDARQAEAQAIAIRDALPPDGLFAGQTWRISPVPFALGEKLAQELETLGRVLLQFYRTANLLYRKSVEGSQPEWIARWLDLGKPADLIALQRHATFRQDTPRVIRPDILLTDDGFAITELDSVPGGIGLTAWLNQTYSALRTPHSALLGGSHGMLDGFASIFGDAQQVHIVVSEEAATYRPEMKWLAQQLNGRSGAIFNLHPSTFSDFSPGSAVYRFFELFDLANVPNARRIFELAVTGQIRLTPPPKPLFEEKLLLALLWNRNLERFWRQELGGSFFERLRVHVPRTWLLDPAPLPPHGAIPGLELTDWSQLKLLSQRERELILKISGFSAEAWGARGVYLGSDLSQADWSAAVDRALQGFAHSPYVLQRYHKPAVCDAAWWDFDSARLAPMKGRVRLCPYYFVAGENQAARAKLGGVLATIAPADKKIVHGMTDAVLAPCSI